MLFPQQISEGAVGLLKGAQLLQEKFLLPRQGVDVGASHLFLLEEKLCYMAQGAHARVTAGGTGPRSVRTGRHQEAQQEELGQGQVGLLKWAWGMGEVEKGMGVLSVWSGQASCRRKGRW